MNKWVIEVESTQQVLTHYCEHVRESGGSHILRQDIGGGYIRCSLCGDKYLPQQEPGNPRLLLRVRPAGEAPVS